MSTTPHTMASLVRELRQRLDHNLRYLLQSAACRQQLATLTYGQPVTPDWVQGEQDAIEAENEWLVATLAQCEARAAVRAGKRVTGARG